ncbi:MAG: phage major capsid protein, partial [Bacteroidaceae bacterium]|nr:phage major capsid protein [Bacteroidaceae bacterium]
MRKSFLEKRQQRLMAKRDEMKKTALASESVDEVRSINAKIEEINEELDEIAEELAVIAEDEKRAAAVPAGSQPVNGAIVASYNAQVVQTRSDDNPLGSMEYRKAFRDYIQRGVAIPEEMRSQLNDYRATLPADMRDAMPISTADTAPAIPLTVMNEVINTVRKRYGNLYRKVRKLSVAGGVDIPVGAL